MDADGELVISGLEYNDELEMENEDKGDDVRDDVRDTTEYDPETLPQSMSMHTSTSYHGHAAETGVEHKNAKGVVATHLDCPTG